MDNAPQASGTDWLDPQTYQDLTDGLGPKVIELATHYGLATLGALIVLVVAWVVSGWARAGAKSVLERTHIDPTTANFIATIARWGVIVGGIIVCLGVFGVETTSLAALLGGAGVGLGVALQGNLANLASGMMLIAFRPFSDRDWIELTDSDVDGRIRKVGLVFTEMDTFTNKRIVIPNQLLFDQPLVNHEKHVFRRVDVEIGVAYDTDLEHATSVMMDVANEVQHDDAHREARVWWTSFGDSSINAKVCAWCRAADLFETRNRLILGLKRALDDEGIEIPFPQRDLHLHDGAIAAIEELAAK